MLDLDMIKRKITVPRTRYYEAIINVRREYEDAIVYMVYTKYIIDMVKSLKEFKMALIIISTLLKILTATVAHEDDYDREQGTKILEHVIYEYNKKYPLPVYDPPPIEFQWWNNTV